MKKAKALFAGAMIVLVAGTSAVFWYLNDQGIIGGRTETSSDEGIVSGAYDDENPYYYNEKGEYEPEPGGEDAEPDKTQNSETTTTAPEQNGEADDVSYESVNRFLSDFALVYFAESAPYAADSRSNYELIRFAYSLTRQTDPDAIITKQESDSIGYYYGVSYDTVNEVLKNYLDVTVGKESVYTESDYAFFRYEDGYFYTPAADGVGFCNRIVADSVAENGDTLTVAFTVYSDGVSYNMTAAQAHESGEKYASGSAKIRKNADGYTLLAYRLNG